MMTFTSTAKATIQSVTCCILYDSKEGVIKHVHRVITLTGADEQYQPAIEERTIKLASDLGIDTSSTQALVVEDKEFDSHKKYKVDITSRSLVEIDEKGYTAL